MSLSPGNFRYNGAISPDRRVDASIGQFGNSFVIGFNESSALNNINPGIATISSVGGGALSNPVSVKNAGGPYRDFSCNNNPPGEGFVCRWGDYSAATPDPKPAGVGGGNRMAHQSVRKRHRFHSPVKLAH